ncbi:MAG: hypothetical protein M3530_04700 [Thermoproteota archaeon]|nr:hypothetical protein [Thermoproteota archaeon]
MQRVTYHNTLKELQIRLLDEIEDLQNKQKFQHSTTFNRSIQNKIALVKQILLLTERYPKMAVKELLYLIDCRIEGEKILLSNCRTTDVSQIHHENCDNIERIRYIVRKAGKV